MNKTNTTSRYTYADFAADVVALVNGELELTDDKSAAMVDKANALLAAQVKKSEYNATHAKKSAPKGPSTATMDKANSIASVLTAEPMTTAEINAALGTDYTPLQVANACRYICGVTSCKVVRSTVNAKGLKSDKEYTAYTMG